MPFLDLVPAFLGTDQLGSGLRADIETPVHCGLRGPLNFSSPASLLAAAMPIRPPPAVHVWLGRVLVSPLHFDTQHNVGAATAWSLAARFAMC